MPEETDVIPLVKDDSHVSVRSSGSRRGSLLTSGQGRVGLGILFYLQGLFLSVSISLPRSFILLMWLSKSKLATKLLLTLIF